MLAKKQQQSRTIIVTVISITVLYALLSSYSSRHHSASSSTRSPVHDGLAAVDTPGGSPSILQEKQQGVVHRTRQSQQQPSLNAPSNKNIKKTATAPKKNRKNTILIQKPIPPKPPARRANAAFVMLVRNSDGQGARSAVRQIEDRFNRNFQYPYVFLNDVPFTEEFKALVRPMSKANMTFGLVPEEHWSYPEWISTTKAKDARKAMAKVVYGWSESYRHMCRYATGVCFYYISLSV